MFPWTEKKRGIFIKMNDTSPPPPTFCVYSLCGESEINVSWMLIVIDMLNTKQHNTCRQGARGDQKKKDRITILAMKKVLFIEC